MSRSGAQRIPSLDGLRAISIALVLLSHLCGTRNFPLAAGVGNFWEFGGLGVRVFFVISGFLITGLLLDELATSGRVRLWQFYLRRTLRIFPPYYAMLAAIVIASWAGAFELAPRDVAHTLTYTSNYYPERSWHVGHTWSLSVEEQFYLLWPAVLLLAGTRRALLAAAAVVLLVPFIRIGEWEFFRAATGTGIGARFETIADSIAIGCLLAGLRPWLHSTTWYPRLLASPFFVVVPVLGLVGHLTHDHPLVSFFVGMSLTNLCVVLCIDWAVTFHDGRIGRVLNAAPLVFVGWMSYSLYLWQQPFLNRASSSALTAFPLNIVLAVAVAVASYYLIEQPSLRLRRVLERRARMAPAPAASAALQPELQSNS